MKRFLALGLAALAVAACDEASSKDPATATRDALNPPSGLVTVTWDKKIELRWQAMNAEEDFKGFRVFAAAKTISALPASAYPKLPNGNVVDLRTSAVPRCDQNSALFEVFGFPAIEAGDKECEGDDATDSGATAADAKEFDVRGKGMLLAEEEEEGTDTAAEGDEEDEDALPPQVVKCANEAGTVVSTDQLSLPAAVPTLTEQVCIVTALADGTALANGTTYTFFVAAIMADDTFEKVEVSWTSNFVEDTPSTVVFQGTIELDAAKMQYISLGNLQKKEPFTELDSADCSPAKGPGCFVNQKNTLSEAGIYFGRNGDGDYPQRTFISATAGDDIALLLRGPQTQDSRDPKGTIATSIPGDQAADGATANYDKEGVPQAVYGNQVFDFTVVIAGATHYGKVVVGDVALASPTDETSLVSYPITVLLQTAPNTRHYLR